MTIVVAEEHKDAIQVAKQLAKLIEVISVTDVTEQRHVSREMVLAKVAAPEMKRSEICSSPMSTAPKWWMCRRAALFLK